MKNTEMLVSIVLYRVGACIVLTVTRKPHLYRKERENETYRVFRVFYRYLRATGYLARLWRHTLSQIVLQATDRYPLTSSF